MKDIFKMLKDAASMKKNVKRIQSELRKKTVEFSCENGKVSVTARGDASIANIKIDPSVIDPSNAMILEKLVLEAVEGALDAAKEMSSGEMKKLASQMGLPDIPGL